MKHTGTKKVPGTVYIGKIILHVARGDKVSQHELFFDHDPLTQQEMYCNGFLGDMYFKGEGIKTEKAEVEAGPVGEFEGDKVGKFVFRIKIFDDLAIQNAHVVKMNFSTYKK